MKLAVMKVEGHIPGGGFHYMMYPLAMKSDFEAECFKRMGHVIIDVPDTKGEQLIKSACAALQHQLEVAVFTDAAESLSSSAGSSGETK